MRKKQIEALRVRRMRLFEQLEIATPEEGKLINEELEKLYDQESALLDPTNPDAVFINEILAIAQSRVDADGNPTDTRYRQRVLYNSMKEAAKEATASDVGEEFELTEDRLRKLAFSLIEGEGRERAQHVRWVIAKNIREHKGINSSKRHTKLWQALGLGGRGNKTSNTKAIFTAALALRIAKSQGYSELEACGMAVDQVSARDEDARVYSTSYLTKILADHRETAEGIAAIDMPTDLFLDIYFRT
ncbi:MAG: hypothetical protein AAGB19_02455 [Cyanobacteria bacterium P01_F01_bin.3]